jgi:hypothetical protein
MVTEAVRPCAPAPLRGGVWADTPSGQTLGVVAFWAFARKPADSALFWGSKRLNSHVRADLTTKSVADLGYCLTFR